ncbi:MAG TPA: YihY/virulence factor BrkB family protein [Nitrolancea sp.]|nr:YihY/virulence factor BrkB family protein [Nitrolancea sp.]
MTSSAATSQRMSRAQRKFPIKALGKSFISEFKNDDLLGMAAEIAYHLIFAIPPILLLIITGAAVLNIFTNIPVVESLRSAVDQHAPTDLVSVFDSTIRTAIEKANGGAVSLGAIVTAIIALWSSSNAVSSLMKGLNRTFDVEERRPLLKQKSLALGLTLMFLVLFDAAFVLFVFGRQLGEWIARRVGLGKAFADVWNLARWPVAVIFMMLLLAILYYLGPSIDHSFRWVSPGSVVATILWVAVVFGFKLYLAISNPGSAYGAFGALVVLLFFLYITGLIFLFGAELNAVLQKRYDEETVRFRAAHPEALEDDASRSDARIEAIRHDLREGTTISLASNPLPPRPTTITHFNPNNHSVDPTNSQGALPPRTLVGGAMAIGIAGLIGWFVGRHGSRVG